MKNKLIAHRGLHDKDTPENSMGALKKALEKDIAIEFDVHLLKDNKIVVFHDNNLKRMTGIDKKINELSYDEIKYIKLANSDEKIPLLEDVLKLVNGKVLLDIELKCDHEKYKLEDALIDVLKDYTGKIVLKSFDYKTVNYLKKKTSYKVGLLIKNLEGKNINKVDRYLLKSNLFLKYIKPDFIACDYRILDYKNIKRFRTKNPIFTWTIKDKNILEQVTDKADYYLVENII